VLYHFSRSNSYVLDKNSQNRLAAKSAPPSDATFLAFSGFCDEPPGGYGGPARRRALELHILTCFDASVIWLNCCNYIILMMLSLT